MGNGGSVGGGSEGLGSPDDARRKMGYAGGNGIGG